VDLAGDLERRAESDVERGAGMGMAGATWGMLLVLVRGATD